MDAVWGCGRLRGTPVLSERTSSGRLAADYARFALLRASPCGQQGMIFFLCFTARLKPCPDTCMVDGCGVAVQAGVGVGIVRENIKKRRGGFIRASRCCARACGAR